MNNEKLKEEFFKQYLEEIAKVKGLSIKDCDYSWDMNRSLIKSMDDIDEVIENLKRE